MSHYPQDLKYTRDHEWLRIEGDIGIVGVTYHAQVQLGEVVFVELSNVGDTFERGEPLGSIESVKAVAEVYASVSGSIVEINVTMLDSPELVNDDPYGDGWLVKIRISQPEEVNQLLSAKEYEEFIKEESA